MQRLGVTTMTVGEKTIYFVTPALVAAILGMAFVFWSDFVTSRTSYISHIHGGALFFYLLLAMVIGAVAAAVFLMAFARMVGAKRFAAFVATLPFISILVSALLFCAAMLR